MSMKNFINYSAVMFLMFSCSASKQNNSGGWISLFDGKSLKDIDFKTENQDLLRKFYNHKINYYFKKINKQLVKILNKPAPPQFQESLCCIF